MDCVVGLSGNSSNRGRSRPARGFRLAGVNDVRKLCGITDCTHRDLTDKDVSHVAGAYRPWRRRANTYEDDAGSCESVF